MNDRPAREPRSGTPASVVGDDGEGAGPRRPRRGRRVVAWLLLAALLLAAVAGGVVFWALGPVDPSDDRTIVFEVPRGRSATGVAQDLVAVGLARDVRLTRAYLSAIGATTRIGEGLYDLRRDQPLAAIAEALVAGGRPRTARFLLPEGIRLDAVVARVADAGWPPSVTDELATLLAAPPEDARPEGLPDGATLEGYLFPATYDLPVGFEAADILAALRARFDGEVSSVVRAELEAAGLTLHAWTTLASMVQAEAADETEMAIIAGVFLNRLDVGMLLQSDPTVAYGLGKALPELDFPGGDFEVDHPWNTYTRGGLPAGPIGNPGAAALAAVLAPQRRDEAGRPWLFFLHGRDGDEPVFRPNLTYEDHLQDIARYLR